MINGCPACRFFTYKSLYDSIYGNVFFVLCYGTVNMIIGPAHICYEPGLLKEFLMMFFYSCLFLLNSYESCSLLVLTYQTLALPHQNVVAVVLFCFHSYI